ncbi:MAG: hypothetical protein H6Q90_2658 [Deltaproteobacteria bacterium]|nr:hypothetical protein [Deltaproteobacteria bacterium]
MYLGDTLRVTGRYTQLGRQLRRLRHIAGGRHSADLVTTLRRATQLARDLACESADVDDAGEGFKELSVRGVLEPALSERLTAWVASQGTRVSRPDVQGDAAFGERAMAVGRDLDRFLRSLEIGAPAPEIPFEPIVPAERGIESSALAAASARLASTAAVTISGRILEIEVRGGRAVIAVDDRPIAMTLDSGAPVTSFALAAAPTSNAEVRREQTGVTRVAWIPEHLVIELAPDFASARFGRDPDRG